LDDDFERVANDSTANAALNLGSNMNGNNQYMKQKDFIIKKMFKVPSNEQMTPVPPATFSNNPQSIL
jgi:hypothetical protein